MTIKDQPGNTLTGTTTSARPHYQTALAELQCYRGDPVAKALAAALVKGLGKFVSKDIAVGASAFRRGLKALWLSEGCCTSAMHPRPRRPPLWPSPNTFWTPM